MPIVFFYFIGTVTGGFGGGGGGASGPEKLAVEVGSEAGVLGDQVIRRLEDQDFEVVRLDPDPDPDPNTKEKIPSRRVVIPADLTERIAGGEVSTVALTRRGGGGGGGSSMSGDYDDIRVGRAVYTVLADLVALRKDGVEPSPEAFDELAARPRALKLEVKPAGKRKTIPSGYAQTIPGTMVMFTMLVLLTSGATLLVVERNQGLLRRLASSPMPRGGIVAGKWAGKMSLGLVQIGFAMAVGTVLFGMDWGPDLGMVVLVLFAWAAFNASLGMVLGNLARSEGQAAGIGVVSTMVLAALGGCWWPIEIVPSWMQSFAIMLPTGWTMDAMHRLINFALGAGSALPHVLGLSLGAVVLGWIATRCFRFVE